MKSLPSGSMYPEGSFHIDAKSENVTMLRDETRRTRWSRGEDMVNLDGAVGNT